MQCAGGQSWTILAWSSGIVPNVMEIMNTARIIFLRMSMSDKGRLYPKGKLRMREICFIKEDVHEEDKSGLHNGTEYKQ